MEKKKELGYKAGHEMTDGYRCLPEEQSADEEASESQAEEAAEVKSGGELIEKKKKK